MKKLIVLLLVMMPFCLCAQKKDSLIINILEPIGNGEPLYVLRDKIITKAEASKIKAADVNSVTSIKPPGSVTLYGAKAKNGVFIIKLKEVFIPPANTYLVSPNTVFYLNGKKISDEEAEKLSPDDMVESTMTRYPEGVLKNGQPDKIVMNLISKKFAKQAYQEKFSKLSVDYKTYLQKYKSDSNWVYVIGYETFKFESNERLKALYKLPLNKIDRVIFAEEGFVSEHKIIVPMVVIKTNTDGY